MRTPSPSIGRFGAAFVLLAAGCLAPSAAAQYSSDPATPLAVRATAGDDVQARLAPAPNGGHYISYFSGTGYDVMIDRLDAGGVSVWGGPVMVEDRGLSSTVDYGLASDANGNAYVCFNTTSAKTTFPIQKVTSIGPDGAIRWSSTVYTASGASLGNGRCVVASDGFVWGATSVGFDSAIQRFDPNTGAPSFASAVYITESGAKQICSGLQPSTSGSVILSTIRYTTTFSNKILRAHKLLPDGTRPWAPAGNAVASAGNIQTGNFPDFTGDGAGGAYFSWYTTNPLTCRVQHMDAAGNMTWGVDGVPVGTSSTGTFGGASATLNRTNPSTVLGGDGRVYCFFRSYSGSIAGIVWFGIGAQCFNADGTSAWGADGVMVEDHAPSATGIVYDRQVGVALKFGGDVGVCYANYSTAVLANAVAARMNFDGTLTWKTTVASNPSVKFRFTTSSANQNAAVFSWQGGASTSSSDIYCARIAANGSIGQPPPPPGDVNGDNRVNAADLAILLGQWGTSGNADFNGDGFVDAADLSTLLAGWTG